MIDAQNNLSGMYALGLGVERNFVLAYMWSTLAIAGDAENADENRKRIAQRMTEEEVAKAERMAQEWQPVE
jgi:TPR repeat protein